MMRIGRGDRILITGATSGIGRELARQCGARGCRVAITGRREGKLREAARELEDAGGEALPLVGSVTDPSVVRAQHESIRSRWGGLDVAILNAGIGDAQNAREFRADLYRRTFETNVLGACHWLEAILPDMIEAGRGAVVGISSPAGWRGLPQTGAYSSSKAALTTLLESLRVDLRGTGVRVTTVCPGWVKSEITDRNDPKQMFMLLETDDAARRILRGVERERRLVHFPWPLTALVRYLLRPMPAWLYEPLAARLIKRDKKPYVDPNADRERPS